MNTTRAATPRVLHRRFSAARGLDQEHPMTTAAYTSPPAEVVDFLQRVFEFAETLSPPEGLALRRLVRAGLMADEGTIEQVLGGDTSGYAVLDPAQLAVTTGAWYLTPEPDEHPLMGLYA